MSNGIYLPTLTKCNKIIIIVLVACFLLFSLTSQIMSGFSNIFALNPGTFFAGFIFQLVTYPLVAQGPIELIFNCLLFWFIGCELEKIWGVKRYLTFLAVSSLGGGIIYLLLAGPLLGLSLSLSGTTGMTSALLIAYSIINPDQVFSFMLIFPMRAKYFCLLLIALQLYMGIFSPAGVLAWGHLGAMGSGFLYLIFASRLKSRSRPKRKGHLRVVSSDDEEPPKYWH